MQRIVLALIVLSIAIVAGAQAEQVTEPPPPPPDQRVPTQPAQPGVVPPHALMQSMVRFVHVAPNLEIERLLLVDTIDGFTHEEIHDLEYLEVSEYVPVPEGQHEVILDVIGLEDEAPTQITLDQVIGTVGGHFFTIAIVGLTMPEDPATLDEGFFAWLEDLFTPDRDDLALRTVVIEDIATAGATPADADVRILHAAPGTEAVELVLVEGDETVEVLGRVGYAEVGAQSIIRPDDGWLEVRLADSGVVVADLREIELASGMIHTVIVAGTPVEDVPIEVEVLRDEWMDPMAIPPRAPGVMPARHAWPVAEAAWINERLMEAEAWLADAEARLDALRDEEQVAEAMREIDEARQLVEHVRVQFERMAVPEVPEDRAPETE